jgi:hypothetical protein
VPFERAGVAPPPTGGPSRSVLDEPALCPRGRLDVPPDLGHLAQRLDQHDHGDHTDLDDQYPTLCVSHGRKATRFTG